jgi:hypothetical protein
MFRLTQAILRPSIDFRLAVYYNVHVNGIPYVVKVNTRHVLAHHCSNFFLMFLYEFTDIA